MLVPVFNQLPPPRLHSPGVNVVFDPVGGSALLESLKCVAWGSHYLVIGFAAGDIPKVCLGAEVRRRWGQPL